MSVHITEMPNLHQILLTIVQGAVEIPDPAVSWQFNALCLITFLHIHVYRLCITMSYAWSHSYISMYMLEPCIHILHYNTLCLSHVYTFCIIQWSMLEPCVHILHYNVLCLSHVYTFCITMSYAWAMYTDFALQCPMLEACIQILLFNVLWLSHVYRLCSSRLCSSMLHINDNYVDWKKILMSVQMYLAYLIPDTKNQALSN